LAQPLGETTGWFSTAVLPDDQLEKSLINIAGYPGDRGDGKELYHAKNRILQVTDRRIFYDLATFGGQSGSPVWIQKDANSPVQAVGIHAYGVGGTPTNVSVKANSAPRIIPEVLELIKGWIAGDSAA
jgi:V8-like Glu-specific endopeptidase